MRYRRRRRHSLQIERRERCSLLEIYFAMLVPLVLLILLCLPGSLLRFVALFARSSHVVIVVDRPPDVGLLLVLDFNAIRVAFLPELQDFACVPVVFTQARLHGIAHLESQGVLGLALQKAINQPLLIKVLADEDEATLADFVVFPDNVVLVEATFEKHVNPLENKFPLHPLDSKHTFVAKQVLANCLQQLANPLMKAMDVEFALELCAAGRHTVVVFGILVVREEIRVDIQGTLEIESADSDQLLRIDPAVFTA
jgi:hypothetical protein